LNVGIAFEDAFLLAVGDKPCRRNARRHAGIAVLAMGAIQVIATAPESHFRQVGIDVHIHRLTWIEKQRRRLFFGQVAARMGLSGIKLQSRQLSHDQPSGSTYGISVSQPWQLD
jgi:hypothetical protein